MMDLFFYIGTTITSKTTPNHTDNCKYVCEHKQYIPLNTTVSICVNVKV